MRSSLWIRLSICLSIPLLSFAALAATLTTATEPLQLHFHTITFDPLEQSVEELLPANLLTSKQRSSESNLYIIQFDGPIGENEKTTLTALGAQLIDYVPTFAFTAFMDSAAANQAKMLDNVRWVGLYHAGLRLAPAVRDDFVETRTVSQAELIVVVPISAEMPTTRNAILALGGTILDQTTTKFHIEIDSSQITKLANLPAVSWIEPAPTWELFNGPAAGIMGITTTRNTLGLYGSGQIIGIADTGFDQGSLAPATMHDDFENGSGTSRVIAIYDRVGDGADDINSGHGTHVAASALGNGVLSGAYPLTNTYPLSAHAGTAPQAQLVFQAVEDNTTEELSGIPNDLNVLFTEAYTSGARIHNNSWGSSLDGAYSSFAQDIDQFMWNNPDMLVIFSAGNDGTDGDSNGVIDRTSMGSPGTAKNSLTVGASENYRPSFCCWPGYVAPIGPSHSADNINGLAPFSSRGYTLDWRTKPDVVAPGTMIASARSADCQPSCIGWGAIDSNYMYLGGTSMASPLVAGSAALVREYYQNNYIANPSAALIKATLINGSVDIFPGQYGTGATQEISQTRPSPHAGWGRIELQNTLAPNTPRQLWYWDNTSGLNTGESIQYTFEITQSDAISATLVWTDYPGSPAAAGGLVNDLDLQIESPNGTIYYPNHAMQAGAAQHLSYLNSTFPTACFTTNAGEKRAIRFTPTSYPATLELGQFFVGSNSGSYPKTFTYELYDDDGLAGSPSTLLGSGSTSLAEGGWHPVDLTSHSITLTTGDIYLAFIVPDTDFVYCGDTTNIDGRGYAHTGSWAITTTDYAIQTVFSGVAPSTNYDRINNVVGIDLASPATGVYTATVSGYNVPQGPQPYAFVVNGVGRLSGTEVYTQSIDGAGTYVFANTGVSMTFASEDIDSVIVTVQRNTQPPGSGTFIDRYYYLEAIGGGGVFSADVTFTYDQSEFDGSPASGQAESNMQIARYSGGSWTAPTNTHTLDTSNNTITVENISAFSGWSLSNFAPTAVGGVSAETNDSSKIWLTVISLAMLLSIPTWILTRRTRSCA